LNKQKTLEECIDLEIVKTEKRRLSIFIGVLTFGLLLQITNMTLFPITLSEVFIDARSMNLGLFVTFSFILILSVSRILVGKLFHCEKPLPLWYKVYSTCIDSLIPFFLLFNIMRWEKNGAFLDSPLILIIPIIIIVSALHLSFWLSFLNGLIIATTYSMLTFWAFKNFADTLMLPSVAYYTKAIFYLLAGVCAGLVASELKKRLSLSIQNQEERDQIDELFSQQVSKEVADALKTRGGMSLLMEAAVLFLDIRDFTTKVQRLSPEGVNAFQNKFFGPIISCITHHNGVVNQIMGDGFMATFSSVDGTGSEENSFNAAMDILNKINSMNQETGEEIKVGIGIHSGEIIAGNIGTQERSQFSISGIPVITAARLEQLTKDYASSLLVSKSYYTKIKHLAKSGTSLGSIKLKGIESEVEIIKIA